MYQTLTSPVTSFSPSLSNIYIYICITSTARTFWSELGVCRSAVCVRARVFVRACVHACMCMRVCARVRVRACVSYYPTLEYPPYPPPPPPRALNRKSACTYRIWVVFKQPLQPRVQHQCTLRCIPCICRLFCCGVPPCLRVRSHPLPSGCSF